MSLLLVLVIFDVVNALYNIIFWLLGINTFRIVNKNAISDVSLYIYLICPSIGCKKLVQSLSSFSSGSSTSTSTWEASVKETELIWGSIKLLGNFKDV